ncbi:response regulator [Sphingomonas sp. I4]
MRVLISGALERIKGVTVVGAADGAAEARQMVDKYRPEVMTLDVEMPGMSGLEYLAEIMESRPMPVIMFSTRTAAGAAESIEALRLGAIDCFPSPRWRCRRNSTRSSASWASASSRRATPI